MGPERGRRWHLRGESDAWATLVLRLSLEALLDCEPSDRAEIGSGRGFVFLGPAERHHTVIAATVREMTPGHPDLVLELPVAAAAPRAVDGRVLGKALLRFGLP